MTRVKGCRVNSEDGGTLVIDSQKPMEVEGSLRQTSTGMAFGPLEISAYPDSEARVGGLEFQEVESLLDKLFGGDSSGLFGLLAAGSLVPLTTPRANQETETSGGLSRRSFMQAAGVAMLAAGASTQASAETATPTATPTGEETTYQKAQFVALSNPSGLRIRVLDRTSGVLPPDESYYTFSNGDRYDRFAAAVDTDYGDVLPERTGTVTVGPEGASGGFLARLRADKTQVYEGLALPKAVSDADSGEPLTITDNDIIVEHVQTAGESNTILSIDGVSIPHIQESQTESVGYFEVHNGSLVYRPGSDPPTGQSASLILYADASSEILDDISRRV